MPNIASVLKSEITRIARKEVRAEVEVLKKSLSGHRNEIATLKRRLTSLEQDLRRLGKSLPEKAPQPMPEQAAKLGRTATVKPNPSAGFSAADLASQRMRLGLTIDGCALLLGTSGKSIYRWETQRAQPRESYWPSLAALRTLSVAQAAEIVAGRK